MIRKIIAWPTYLCLHGIDVSAADLAKVFNVEPRVILLAVKTHYWLFALGDSGDFTKIMIGVDGE